MVRAVDVAGNVVYVTRDYYGVDKAEQVQGGRVQLVRRAPASDSDGRHGGEGARLAALPDGHGCGDDGAPARRPRAG